MHIMRHHVRRVGVCVSVLWGLSSCYNYRINTGGKVALSAVAISAAATTVVANVEMKESATQASNGGWMAAAILSAVAAGVCVYITSQGQREVEGNAWQWGVTLPFLVALSGSLAASIRYGSWYIEGGGANGPNCVKGCRCGNTCIDCSEVCHL